MSDQQTAEQVRAISGHFDGHSLANLLPERRIVRSLILREPQSLMLSWYNFRIMRYMLKGQKPYSFSLFLRSMRMNPVAHFILERWVELPWIQMSRMSDDVKAALLDKTLEQLDYVVDISETDSLISSLTPQIGIAEYAPRRNTAEQNQKKSVWKVICLEDLSWQDRLLLRSRTSLDRYLWRRWALKENIVFDHSKPTGFLFSELVRPSYQIQRRTVRRFG